MLIPQPSSSTKRSKAKSDCKPRGSAWMRGSGQEIQMFESLELCVKCYREGHMAGRVVMLNLNDAECECKCCLMVRAKGK